MRTYVIAAALCVLASLPAAAEITPAEWVANMSKASPAERKRMLDNEYARIDRQLAERSKRQIRLDFMSTITGAHRIGGVVFTNITIDWEAGATEYDLDTETVRAWFMADHDANKAWAGMVKDARAVLCQSEVTRALFHVGGLAYSYRYQEYGNEVVLGTIFIDHCDGVRIAPVYQ